MAQLKINEKIAVLRKQNGMSQDEVAKALGITNQAVSKWESGQSCPDIGLLPDIARLFHISIGELFGEAPDTSFDLPWENDGILRIVVYRGKKLLNVQDESHNLRFDLNGDVMNVISYCNIECQNVQNGIEAHGDIVCKGDVSGGVAVQGDFTCDGSISGGAACNGDMCVQKSISGAVRCNGDCICYGDINGQVHCEGDITYKKS